ncbi:MAG: hypothetical protein EKK71_01245 [Candidatus Competibacteraceae bacterium]|nr:MAG: hypothetical protein EKK71_01245 [Candidatus Competibacteraceae bacterium]
MGWRHNNSPTDGIGASCGGWLAGDGEDGGDGGDRDGEDGGDGGDRDGEDGGDGGDSSGRCGAASRRRTYPVAASATAFGLAVVADSSSATGP